MTKSSLVVASAIALAMTCSAVRPASAQTAPQLTALDYFEIQQLVAKYARAIDTCSNQDRAWRLFLTLRQMLEPVIHWLERSLSLGRIE